MSLSGLCHVPRLSGDGSLLGKDEILLQLKIIDIVGNKNICGQ